MYKQQLLDYDKRTLLDKRAIGQMYTNKLLSEAMSQSSTSPTSSKKVPKPQDVKIKIAEEEDVEIPEEQDMEVPEEDSMEIPEEDSMEIPEHGDVIAGVLPGSTMEHPLVIIGKVFRVNHGRQEVRVSRLRHLGGNKYTYEIFGETERIPFAQMVHPIDIHYRREGNYYELRSSVFDIHHKHSYTKN